MNVCVRVASSARLWLRRPQLRAPAAEGRAAPRGPTPLYFLPAAGLVRRLCGVPLPPAGSSWRPPSCTCPLRSWPVCHFCSAVFLPRGPGSLRAADRAESREAARTRFCTLASARTQAHASVGNAGTWSGACPRPPAVLRLGCVACRSCGRKAPWPCSVALSPSQRGLLPQAALSQENFKKGLCLTHCPICSFMLRCPQVLGRSSGGSSRPRAGKESPVPWPAPCSQS